MALKSVIIYLTGKAKSILVKNKKGVYILKSLPLANNKFILTTYTGNGNCIINVMPGGANINCSVGICGTANLLYTDTYNFY